MKILKRNLKYPVIFFVMAVLLAMLLALSACIPKSAIKKNVQKSAEFLCEGELFGCVFPGVEGSKIDRYADSVLLAICYQYDEKHPLTSVMWSSYYYTKYQNENENLLEAVTEDLEANRQYLRYWHGSNAFLRPLLILFSLPQIYALNGMVLVALAVWLFLLLKKQKAWLPMGGMLAGLVLTSSWFVPLSLEYTWTYILMFLMSIISLKLAYLDKWEQLGTAFLLVGMLTSYMDFLTTETLTLFVPLLLAVWIKQNRNAVFSLSEKKNVSRKDGAGRFWKEAKMAGKWILAWGFGYAGMWMMKWGMASVILRQNVMPYVAEHIAERTMGDAALKMGQYAAETIWRNVKCLFPLEYGKTGFFLGMVILGAVLYIGYVYHRKQICRENVILYGMIGVLPFVRYLVLRNHSYLHHFFTYRALFTTILSIAMIVGEVVEWRWLTGADTRKRKS